MKNFGAQLLLCGLSLTAVFTGCRNEDVYVGDVNEAQYRKVWNEEFGKVDPEHTWNMAEIAKANISINMDALSEYHVKICTKNPLFDKSAYLLADYTITTDANGCYKNTFTFDLPQACKNVCAVLVDSHNRPLAQYINVEDDKSLNIRFGINSSGVSTLSRVGDGTTRSTAVTMDGVTLDVPQQLSEYMKDGKLNADAIKQRYAVGSEYDKTYGYVRTTSITDLESAGTSGVSQSYYVEVNNSVQTLSKLDGVKSAEILIGLDGSEATLNIGNISFPNDGNSDRIEFIVGPKATLNISTSFFWRNRLLVFEGGKVNFIVDNTSIGSSAACYVNGIKDKPGDYAPYFYNEGEITGNTVKMYGNNDWRFILYNAPSGIIRLNGLTNEQGYTATNIPTVVINQGRLITHNFGMSGDGSGDHGSLLFNNCLFYCKEKLEVGRLVVGENAAVEADYISLYNPVVELSKNSIVRARIGMYWQVNNQGVIRGPKDGYALIATPKSGSSGINKTPFLNSTGNVFWEVGDKEIVNGIFLYNVVEVDRWDQTKWTTNTNSYDTNNIVDAVKETNKKGQSAIYITYYGGAPLKIPGSSYTADQLESMTPDELRNVDCTGQGNDNPDPDPELIELLPWYITCEDLGAISASDFDFNDVVLKIEHVSTNTTDSKAKVTLMAVGGTLQTSVYYMNGTDKKNLFPEVHDAFATANNLATGNYKQMYNTFKGAHNAFKLPEPVTIDVETNFTMANCAKNFVIDVTRTDLTTTKVQLPSETGEQPMAFCISGDWDWQDEYNDIREKYQSFGEWIKNKDAVDWTGWNSEQGLFTY